MSARPETMPPSNHLNRFPRRAVTAAVVWTVLALACAVSEPPQGGPEDKEKPVVAATIPARDSAGVDPSSPIAIGFSENMTRARVERLVTTQPPITIASAEWDGNTLVIRPEGGLARDTTYVVTLKGGYRDRHGVTATEDHVFAFSTGAVLDTARIEGTVSFKREPSARAVVRCFRVPREPGFDPTAARPDREARTGSDGTYRLRYLPSNDARFVVLAFIDGNNNGTFEKVSEPFTLLADTVVVVAGAPVVKGVDVTVIDPLEPAVVRGTVTNETGIDSLRASVAMFVLDDTTRAGYYTVCDSAGAWEFDKVRAGDYRVQAFLDIRADSLCGTYPCPGDSAAVCVEPCATAVDTLTVAPAATVTVPAIVLRRGTP